MNKPPSHWTLLEYVAQDGTRPVVVFIAGLDRKHKAQAYALIQMLRELGSNLLPPHAKKVETGLYELRGHQVRIFYVFRPGKVIVLLDGILKKSDEIPEGTLQRMRRLRKEIEGG